MAGHAEGRFDDAVHRLRAWVLLLAAIGTAVTLSIYGTSAAGGFLLGAIAAYVNLRLVERAVDRVARLVTKELAKPRGGTGVWVLIQFGLVVMGAFVILKNSGFNMIAAFWGFLVCPAAVIVEILYELVTYDHS